MPNLDGTRVAFLVANEGIEQIELTRPWQAVRDAGGLPQLIAPKPGIAQAFNHLDKADTFPVDRLTSELEPMTTSVSSCPGASQTRTSCGWTSRR